MISAIYNWPEWFGTGGFDCGNNDYFEGQFFGSVYDRYGHLTKVTSEDGCYCVGKWTNGLMEDIFDLTETDGWRRARYQRFVTSTVLDHFLKAIWVLNCLSRQIWHYVLKTSAILRKYSTFEGGFFNVFMGKKSSKLESAHRTVRN